MTKTNNYSVLRNIPCANWKLLTVKLTRKLPK